MKKRFKSLLVAGLLVAGLGSAAAAPQMEVGDACCLAAEWILGVAPPAAQSSEQFCCLAAEWRAEAGQPSGPEQAVQAPRGESCCLAREWDAS
ncbi:MAG: hypothetical protein KDJ33_09035 [Gammaproteobacteria bacterium]|nr:hypothetical protein [Gammaproteobacteria bacterium]